MGTTPETPARSGALAAIGRLLSAGLVVQAVQLGGMVVLARLYAPEQFGVYAVFAALLALLPTVATLRLEYAIQLQPDDAGAQAYARATVMAALAVGLPFCLLLGVAMALAWLPGHDVWQWWWTLLLMVGTVAAAAGTAASALAIRFGHYHAVSRYRIAGAVLVLLAQLGAGLAGFGVHGLVAGVVGGATLALLLLPATPGRPAAGGWLREAWQRHRAWRGQSLQTTLAGVAGILAHQAPLVLVQQFWGSAAAGQFLLAFRVYSAPVGLAAAAISEVAYRETTVRLQRGESLQAYMRRSLRWLLTLSVPAALVTALAAPALVPWAFGAAWAPAGPMLAWLCLVSAFRLASSPVTVFSQYGRADLLLAWQSAFLLACMAAIALPAWLDAPVMTAIAALAITQACFYVLLIYANLALTRGMPAAQSGRPGP